MPGQAVQLAAPGAGMSVGCCAGRSRGAARDRAGLRGAPHRAVVRDCPWRRLRCMAGGMALHGAVARGCPWRRLRGAARGCVGRLRGAAWGCVRWSCGVAWGAARGGCAGLPLAAVALHGRGMARRSRRLSTNRGDCVGGARSDACLSTKSAGCMVWGSSAAEMGLMLEELFLKTQRNRR